jgi:hypothetical protein
MHQVLIMASFLTAEIMLQVYAETRSTPAVETGEMHIRKGKQQVQHRLLLNQGSSPEFLDRLGGRELHAAGRLIGKVVPDDAGEYPDVVIDLNPVVSAFILLVETKHSSQVTHQCVLNRENLDAMPGDIGDDGCLDSEQDDKVPYWGDET